MASRRPMLADLETRGFIYIPGFADGKECDAMMEVFMSMAKKTNYAPVHCPGRDQITPTLLSKVDKLHADILSETCVRADEGLTFDFYYTHADCPTAGESKFGSGPFEGWHQVRMCFPERFPRSDFRATELTPARHVVGPPLLRVLG